MGDFNWVTPAFVAFASPQHTPIAPLSQTSAEYAALPKTAADVFKSKLPAPFKQVLAHFKSRKVGLVVRLNSQLYSPSHFQALGILHLDMIFEDGTCPQLSIVRKFIELAHSVIEKKRKAVAVHCKAGLGRTGCLIGAYLIYRYGFTANEVIAYMRFMRPGMVVGPQQHWLHINQGKFREWWFEDSMKDKLALLQQQQQQQQSTPTRPVSEKLPSNGQTFTPPPHESAKRRALSEVNSNQTGGIGVSEENLPAPTPGQPRKTSKLYGERHNPYTDNEAENDPSVKPETQVVSMQRHTHLDSESEEEYHVRISRRPSQSPVGSHKKRAVSCTTTTTTTTEWNIAADEDTKGVPDVDNAQETQDAPPPYTKTPSSRNGSGAGTLTVPKRRSPLRRSTDTRSGIRKSSGRVGSVGVVGAVTKSR